MKTQKIPEIKCYRGYFPSEFSAPFVKFSITLIIHFVIDKIIKYSAVCNY